MWPESTPSHLTGSIVISVLAHHARMGSGAIPSHSGPTFIKRALREASNRCPRECSCPSGRLVASCLPSHSSAACLLLVTASRPASCDGHFGRLPGCGGCGRLGGRDCFAEELMDAFQPVGGWMDVHPLFNENRCAGDTCGSRAPRAKQGINSLRIGCGRL